MTTQNIYSMVDTWDDGATTFKGISLSVTDTASASGSLLMDLQVGGASLFSVTKAGNLRVPVSGTNLAPSIQMGTSATTGFYSPFTDQVWFTGGGAVGAQFQNGGIRLISSASLQYASSSTNTTDLSLFRDAADTLAQRRSTNPQAFRVYNTYTDASNYERGKIAWESNVLRIGTEKAGTGSARALELQTDGVTRLTISTSGVATFGSEVNVGPSNVLGWGSGRAKLFAPTASVIRLLPDSGDARLNMGGDTSSFPALKRSTTSLQVRLADDSAFTNVQGKITTETAYTAGAPTATGYLVLYDSNGTAYKVPAEAL
jgi:hypothetical protein